MSLAAPPSSLAGRPAAPAALRRPLAAGIAPVPKEMYAPSTAWGIRGAVVILGSVVALVAALPALAELGLWWAYLIVLPLLGAASYKVTILLHECGHRT